MASSVFYRFKSNKDTTRITFDGTGISVFELKKAIIETSNLGDGTDFELILLSSDEKKEYADDTEIIERSTTVIARRRPADRPGKGGAARYVSGKAPTTAKNASRIENMSGKSDATPNISAAASAISELQTEKEREEAILRLGAEQWKQTQKEMASATRVQSTYHKPATTSSNNQPPPEWYLCNRCSVKGHWIKDCPQNGNPDFDDNRRIKKAIGIPRSRLITIDKKTIMGDDGNVDINKLPAGAMVDQDGNYVLVKADKTTWNKLQEKMNQSAAAKEEEIRGSKELQEKGLECPIDKCLFAEPVKTPCCQTTYCNECITNALLDDDLRCPNCGKDGVLIDNLEADTDMIARVKAYQEEKAAAKKAEDAIAAETKAQAASKTSRSVSPDVKAEKAPSEKAVSAAGSRPVSPVDQGSKKRKADDELTSNRASPMPATINGDGPNSNEAASTKEPPRGPKAMMHQGFGTNNSNMNNMNMMNMMNGFPMSMPMSTPGINGMMPMMFDPMAMFNQMNAMNQMMGMGGMNNMNNMNIGGMNGSNSMTAQSYPQQNYNGMNKGNNFRNGQGGQQQPYRQFNATKPNQEESAYFRAPVNPHRSNRRNASTRPADYREI